MSECGRGAGSPHHRFFNGLSERDVDHDLESDT